MKIRWLKYILAVGCFLGLYSLVYEPYNLKITSFNIKNSQLAGIKVVFATDFHIAPFVWEKRRLRKVIDAINEQKADLVILGGDYVNRHNRKMTANPKEIAEELQKISAPKVAVLGNHDSYYGKQEVLNALEDADIPVLDNRNIKLNLGSKEIYIAGVADYSTDKPDIKKALDGANEPIIFVTHSPDVFLKNSKLQAEIALAGHTHGGQIVLPFFGPLLVPSDFGRKYAVGLFYENNVPLLVSSGLGTSLLPLRFNILPEIVVVTFDK